MQEKFAAGSAEAAYWPPALGAAMVTVGFAANVAVTVALPVNGEIVQASVPLEAQFPPLNPVNVDPAAGVAVRLRDPPLSNSPEHALWPPPHVIPDGSELTDPVPEPASATAMTGSALESSTSVAKLGEAP
jgi:hypothetical protein